VDGKLQVDGWQKFNPGVAWWGVGWHGGMFDGTTDSYGHPTCHPTPHHATQPLRVPSEIGILVMSQMLQLATL
jgi:hypothetical protein